VLLVDANGVPAKDLPEHLLRRPIPAAEDEEQHTRRTQCPVEMSQPEDVGPAGPCVRDEDDAVVGQAR
jgi:hypothetical protein